ncbi:hypothetical protein [Microbacterium imperiale]|uniref:Uncharacterized protein n=1 Tax=Microbacterium imperiale TaxID=33884 RepID=A0A9W6HF07_9MICO|nr:hypothetical protein [Microbacterium imperiale]MBP2420041.1 hypothetical protein [Microbacterium imperiale]MDS0198096.1 hypothetical protein [Microbacterium imperiale]BFE40382.1 hypothetical protein GCM10017544_13380 [Microbacterium imperiale]GLJ78642.1 hypothetical protein GCM10017586_03240 [Microbacterium imperiale]
MIAAGLILLAVGALDLARSRLTGVRLGIVLVLLGGALLPLAAWAGAAAWWFAAVAAAAGWAATTSTREPTRWGLWPAAVLGLVTAVAVALIGVREGQGPLERIWPIESPLGVVSLDLAVALVGSLVFLVESGNVIVRASLRGGVVAAAATNALRGGRLIGPLERILVFALTLTGAFTLLAAVLAAKGIVRFPEISRDDEGGDRAEYFLVGSLVSWVVALAAAFLVWWGSAA